MVTSLVTPAALVRVTSFEVVVKEEVTPGIMAVVTSVTASRSVVIANSDETLFTVGSVVVASGKAVN